VPGGVATEAEQVLANLRAVLAAAGLTLADVVRTDIFLADLADFATVNEIYAAAFTDVVPLPARATVESPHLPKGARVEIAVVAYRSTL
jgi:2-iminobutanoate/2-iminopropanoate deaminase